ncbi:MAG: hypothetical protein LVQ95_03140 [Candidatus Micrarchaeales archaeon]|nr:hypothetical protein [Candidatus Micrarchaeales archaeon]
MKGNSISEDELLEALSELEHKQWEHWSRIVAKRKGFEKEVAHWKSEWVPYKELTEAQKEMDRIWARKVISLLKRRRILNR